jgi:hypothetical protein
MSTFVAFIQTPQHTKVLGEIEAHDALAAIATAKDWYGADAGPWPVCIKTAPAHLPDPSRRAYWVEPASDKAQCIARYQTWQYLGAIGCLTLAREARKRAAALLDTPEHVETERPRDPSLHEMMTDTLEEDAREAGL